MTVETSAEEVGLSKQKSPSKARGKARDRPPPKKPSKARTRKSAAAGSTSEPPPASPDLPGTSSQVPAPQGPNTTYAVSVSSLYGGQVHRLDDSLALSEQRRQEAEYQNALKRSMLVHWWDKVRRYFYHYSSPE